MFVDNSFNVANVFTVDKDTGDVQIPNTCTIYGTLNVNEIQSPGQLLVGSQIVIDGTNAVQVMTDAVGSTTIQLNATNGTISAQNIQVPAYFSSVPTGVYSAGDAMRGQLKVPDTLSGITVYTSKCFSTSYVNGVVMSPFSSETVQRVTPYDGYFVLTTSGSYGDRMVNWLIVN